MHESEKVALLAQHPELRCTVMSTAEDVMESQHRQQAIKVAFRKGIGYVDPEEVRRIAARSAPGDEARQDAAALSAELARREALEEERKSPNA